MNYEEALDRALSLIREPESLDAFLRTVPEWREELNLTLAASSSVVGELQNITPSAGVQERALQQLMTVVGNQGKFHLSLPWPTRLLQFLVGYRLPVAGITTALVLALALVVGLPSQSGGGTQTAEAVIEGSVAEVGSGSVRISTNTSIRVVRLSSDTVLTDGFGNTIESSKLTAGQDVVLMGDGSGEDFVASTVELRDRLFGKVAALTGDGFRLNSSKGDFFVFVTPETQFEGVVQVGSFVEIKLSRLSDGTLQALQIEVEDDQEGSDENEGEGPVDENSDSASERSSGPSSVEENSEVESSGTSQSKDEHENQAEDGEGHEDVYDGENGGER